MRVDFRWTGRLVAAAVSAVVLGLAACSGPAPAVCQKGDTRSCTGTGQCAGGQVCLEDGTGYGPCDCGAGGGAGGGSGGGTGGGSGGGAGGGSGGGAGGGGADGGLDGGFDGGSDGGQDGGSDAGLPRGTADFTLFSFAAFRGAVDPTRLTFPASSAPDGGGTDAGAGTVAASFGGLVGLNAWLGALRPSAPNPILVTSGDLLHGAQSLNWMLNDAPVLAGMNWLGLRYATFGEQELLEGTASLRASMGDGGFTWVTTNLQNAATELPQAVRGYALAEVGTSTPPVRVAFLGISSADLEQRAGLGTLGTMTVAPEVSSSLAAARAARDAGADVVVALAHLGASRLDDAGVPVGPLATYAQGVAGEVDVVIGDFGNVDLARDVNGTLVVQGRSRGFTLHQVSVSVVNGQVTSKSAQVFETNLTPLGSDGGSEALLAPYRTQLTAKMDTPLAKTPTRFVRNVSHERLGEANLGNLVADALLDRFRASHGVQVAILNGGGLRSNVISFYTPAASGLVRAGCSVSSPCDVVAADPVQVLPFSLATVVQTVTGQQLWNALENGVSQLPSGAGRMAQVAGVQFTYDATLSAGARVTSVTLCRGGHGTTDAGVVGRLCVNPVAVLSDGTPYVVVSSDFLASGGDGYSSLSRSEEQQTLLLSDTEVLADYLLTHSPADLPCPGLTTACGLSSSNPAQVCGNATDTATIGTTCRALRTQ